MVERIVPSTEKSAEKKGAAAKAVTDFATANAVAIAAITQRPSSGVHAFTVAHLCQMIVDFPLAAGVALPVYKSLKRAPLIMRVMMHCNITTVEQFDKLLVAAKSNTVAARQLVAGAAQGDAPNAAGAAAGVAGAAVAAVAAVVAAAARGAGAGRGGGGDGGGGGDAAAVAAANDGGAFDAPRRKRGRPPQSRAAAE